MKKQQKYHHSVTENGNIQVRIVTEYLDDNDNVIEKKYGDPFTPADINNMAGWDQTSIDIVGAISSTTALAGFNAEKQIKTGQGVEKVTTYDRVIQEDGSIAVRRITRIFDDGKEVGKKFHRSWINPGDDPEVNDVISKEIAKKLHTKEVKDRYKAKKL